MAPKQWLLLALAAATLVGVAQGHLSNPYVSPVNGKAIDKCETLDSEEDQCCLSCAYNKQRTIFYVVDISETHVASLVDPAGRFFKAAPGKADGAVIDLASCKPGSSLAVKNKANMEKFAEVPEHMRAFQTPAEPRPTKAEPAAPGPHAAPTAEQAAAAPPVGRGGKWVVSNTHRASNHLDRYIRPCQNKDDLDCWVSCVFPGLDSRPLPAVLLSVSPDQQHFVLANSLSALPQALHGDQVDTCKRSTTAYDEREALAKRHRGVVPLEWLAEPPAAVVAAEQADPIGSQSVWEAEYGVERREEIKSKGVPIGGDQYIAFKDIYNALKLGAPLEVLTDRSKVKNTPQRLHEAPYVLPHYRIELNVMTGEVYVSMPVSKRWQDAYPDKEEMGAVEYVKNMFSEPVGTLPQGVADMSEAAQQEFAAHCPWGDTGYLWAVAPIMNDDGTVNPDQFRLSISPECTYGFNQRKIKHGDLVPLAIPGDQVHGSRVASEEEKEAHMHFCHSAGERFVRGEAGYLEPSWTEAVTPAGKTFKGSCRGPAHLAGELYLNNDKRLARKKVQVYGQGYDSASVQWLMDADSSYTFMRDSDLYTGVGQMALVKMILAAMHVDISGLWINLLGTSATTDTGRQIEFRIPKNIVHGDDKGGYTPLARDALARPTMGDRVVATLYTPEAADAEADSGFPAVLPDDSPGDVVSRDEPDVDAETGKQESLGDGADVPDFNMAVVPEREIVVEKEPQGPASGVRGLVSKFEKPPQ